MQTLYSLVFVCCIWILPDTLATPKLGWNPPLGYSPRWDWKYNARIHTKPTWPPHVPCRPSHSTVDKYPQHKNDLTSTANVDAFLLIRKQKKQLQKTIQEQKQLITYLQQKVIWYESKEELYNYWDTEFKEVRWAGLAEKELLVLSIVNASNLRRKP